MGWGGAPSQPGQGSSSFKAGSCPPRTGHRKLSQRYLQLQPRRRATEVPEMPLEESEETAPVACTSGPSGDTRTTPWRSS